LRSLHEAVLDLLEKAFFRAGVAEQVLALPAIANGILTARRVLAIPT
jgi:hypothetical protein